MATWNELYARGELIPLFPERAVGEFVGLLERRFSERPLRLWDLCCGAGRHTVSMAELGHRVYGSDGAPCGLELARRLVAGRGLDAELAVADMTVCPWDDTTFHGVVSWGALHHNTLDGIQEALSVASGRLLPGGMLLCTLKSRKADSFGSGEEIEPNTFVQDVGPEAGVPHHYFDEEEIRWMLREWEVLALVERVCDYRVRCDDFLGVNPFDYTVWGVLARKTG